MNLLEIPGVAAALQRALLHGQRICGVCRGAGRVLDGAIDFEKKGRELTAGVRLNGGKKICGACMGAGVLPERRVKAREVVKERRRR